MRYIKFPLILMKIGLSCLSILAAICVANWFFSQQNTPQNLDSFVFADSLKARHHQRLFFPHPQRIFALTDNPHNANVYPTQTQRLDWNVDQFGFRPDYRSNDDITDDTFTIIMIGDSFTYGDDVDHDKAYATLVEKQLLAAGKDVNVINAGVPGYSASQELVYLQELLPKFKPDLVVWNIYENDVTDSNYYCLFQENWLGQLSKLSVWRNNVFRQGFLINLLPLQWARSPLGLRLIFGLGAPWGGDGKLPIATWGCTQKLTPEVTHSLAQRVDHFLQIATQQTRAQGGEIVYIHMPSQRSFIYPVEQNEDYQRKQLIAQFTAFKQAEFFDLNQALTESLVTATQSRADLPIPSRFSNQCLDVAHALYFSNQEEPNTFARHLNPLGNAVIANLVTHVLLQKQLVP